MQDLRRFMQDLPRTVENIDLLMALAWPMQTQRVMRRLVGGRQPLQEPLPAASEASPETGWRQGFVGIDGVRLHWAEVGESNGRAPVVLLHGLNDCHRTWSRHAVSLACDRRVLVPDLPGHGLSGRPDASYKLRWHTHVMAQWFEALGLDTADVVGHSFGGGVAQVLLVECPERIRRLVLVSSGGLGRAVAPALRLAAIPFVVERLGQPFMGLGTRLALKATGDVLSKEETRRLATMNAQPGSARAFARTVRDIIDWHGQRHTLFKYADELSVLPSMAVFWGDRDGVIPASQAQALADYVEGIRVVLFEGCGHYPHHECPDRFLYELRSFLDDPAVPKARLLGRFQPRV